MPDPVHVVSPIPGKEPVAQAVGFVKAMTAFHIARMLGGSKGSFSRQYFLARWFYISAADEDEEVMREHGRRQKKDAERLGNSIS